MTESSGNSILDELAKAGTDPVLLDKLRTDRITADKQLPPMEFLLSLFDVPCCPRGELVAFTGKAKSGKTFVMSMLMAVAAAPRVLAFVRQPIEPLRVLWIDTEQSDQSTQDILRNRLMPIVCNDGSTFPESLYDIFNIRVESWQERLPLVMAAVDLCRPDLVILDGIRDLVDDINDGRLAHHVNERLMHVAQARNCCIACVIHQNKAVEDKTLRGSIGSELTNKAFEVYECEKLPDRTFALKQKLTRKYDIEQTLYFTVDERGLPQMVGAPAGAVQRSAAVHVQSPVRPEDVARRTGLTGRYLTVGPDGSWEISHQLLFRDALCGHTELCGSELRDSVMALCGMKSVFQYNALLDKVKASGLVSMRTEGKRHYYRLAAPD